MNKNGKKNSKYVINWETHSGNILKNFCWLMEHQSLVDVVLCCGNNTIQGHKCLLAANSPFFREEFEKNPLIEQILISGCDFIVLKNVVELMYCGQTVVNEENVKGLMSMVKLFQMKHLENLFADQVGKSDDLVFPVVQFLTKKPKYPTFTYQLPATNIPTASVDPGPTSLTTTPNILKPLDLNAPSVMVKPLGNRGKRTLKIQAEQACVKEAQASRLALACLQKEIASAPQVNSFIIEDTCTETTVENFIPVTESPNYPQLVNCSNEVVNDNLENAMFLPVVPEIETETRKFTADKLKNILGMQTPNKVEIMYKDAVGNFVPINEEVLEKLFSREGIQYQVIDEEGRVSEMQELQMMDKTEDPSDSLVDMLNPILEVGDYLNMSENQLNVQEKSCSIVTKKGDTIPILKPKEVFQSQQSFDSCQENKIKFSPDFFFSDLEISHGSQNDVSTDGDIFIESCKAEKS